MNAGNLHLLSTVKELTYKKNCFYCSWVKLKTTVFNRSSNIHEIHEHSIFYFFFKSISKVLSFKVPLFPYLPALVHDE